MINRQCVLITIVYLFAMTAYAHNGEDEHANHHEMQQKATLTTVDYTLPRIKLVRDDGKTVSLPDELNDGRPVILNFIYTTCKAVCPISSQTFSKFQSKLGDDVKKVHMVSISIDPEQDTPERLADYARKFKAGQQWQHYTATAEVSVIAQRAFDVYHGDKMSHTPVVLLRAAPSKPWLRIDGFISADDLYQEYKTLISAQ